MSDFILSEAVCDFEVVSLEDKDPYTVNFRENSDGVSCINIYDGEIKNSFVMKKFTKMYILFLKKVQSAFDDDSGASTFAVLLDELAKLKDILIYKYKKFLKKEQYNYFLNDIDVVSSTLKEEILKYKRKNFRR